MVTLKSLWVKFDLVHVIHVMGRLIFVIDQKVLLNFWGEGGAFQMCSPEGTTLCWSGPANTASSHQEATFWLHFHDVWGTLDRDKYKSEMYYI